LGIATGIGIRTRVIILACVAAVPLVLVAVYNAKETEAHELEDAYRETLVLARALASLQADVIVHTRQLLYGLAAGFDARPEALFDAGCEAILRRIAQAGAVYSNITVADGRGDVRCSVEPLSAPVNVGDRAYFRQAAGGVFALSGPITGRVTGKPILVAAQPVGGARAQASAVLLASLDLEALGAAFQRALPPPDVVVNLLDSGGRVVARHPHVPGYIGRTLEGFHPMLQVGAGNGEGVAKLTGLDGVRRVTAYSPLRHDPGARLYVVVGVPQERIERQASELLRRNLAAIAATLALALAMGFIGAQRLIVGPLRQLTAAARRYRDGEPSARSGIPHSAGEIGALANAFDELAGSNQRLTRALRALSAGNRTLLKEKTDEEALLGAMCRVAVEQAHYRLAFVNFSQHDEARSIRTVARAGHDEGFIDSLNVTWADTERGRATAGTAIRSGRTSVIRSVRSDPRFAPWREAAVARGYGSVASFPLYVEGAVIGTFTLVAAEEDAFDDGELALLEEMAADLAFGIEVLRSNLRRQEAEERARRAVTHDPLTGLPGRIPFLRALEEAMGRARANGDRLGLLVVHLPNTQDLHDSLGHEATNAAVREGAARLRFAMNPASYLARLGADEFALLLPRASAEALADLARRFLALVSTPISIGGIPVTVRMSAGATLYPQHGDDPDLLLRRAAIAARDATRRELPFYLYSGATERENPDRLALAAQLRDAIDRGELSLHFQPKIDLRHGGVRGVEALVRWQHAQKGMIAPMQFVPIAEHTGLIQPMTLSVIDLAIRQVHDWRRRGIELPCAINLSPRNLHDAHLLEKIDGMLRARSVPGTALEFEITESALAEDPGAARAVLEKLRGLGCRLYIDDFGTGYSSLSYLVSLPVDALKIDRSFVRQMGRSAEARAVVSSIVSLAAQLRLETVAEGVETGADADMLRQLGCEAAQGYFFGRPVPAGQLRL
jgi:diguanylate cyclase